MHVTAHQDKWNVENETWCIHNLTIGFAAESIDIEWNEAILK